MAVRAERSRNAMEQLDETSIEIEDSAELNFIRKSKLEKGRFYKGASTRPPV